MIVSKANLKVVSVAKPDAGIPILNNVHFEEDGSSVASNSKSIVVCGPVHKEVMDKVVVEDSGQCELSITADTVKEVLKNVPVDKQFGGLLEHVDLDDEGTFRLSDGKRKRRIVGQKYDRKYLDYKKTVREIAAADTKARVVVNLARFITALETVKDCLGDAGGGQKVFIEFTEDNDILIRCRSARTGQRVVCTTTTYKEDTWLKKDKWEKHLLEGGADVDRRKVFHKKV